MTAERSAEIRREIELSLGEGPVFLSIKEILALMDEADKARAEIERLKEWCSDRDFQFSQRCKILEMLDRIRKSGFDLEPFTANTPELIAYDPLKMETRIAELEKELNPGDCYCVCHSTFSSRSSCDHCKEINSVSDFHLRKKIAELEKERDAAQHDAKVKHIFICDILEAVFPGEPIDTIHEWDVTAMIRQLHHNADAAIAQRDGLRRAVEAAACGGACASRTFYCLACEIVLAHCKCGGSEIVAGGCDCWKLDALAAVPAPTREDDGRLDAIREALTILNELPYVKDNPVDRAITILIATATAVPAPAVNANKKTGPHVVCSICGSPAEFIEAEGVYRHKGDSHDDRYIAQILCDKYGYSIEVVAAVPAPALPESPFVGTLRELISTTPDEAELKRQIINAIEGSNTTMNTPAPRPLTKSELKRWSRDRMEGLAGPGNRRMQSL